MERKTFWIAKNSTRLDLYIASKKNIFRSIPLCFYLRFASSMNIVVFVTSLFRVPPSFSRRCTCVTVAISSGNMAMNIEPHKICVHQMWTLPFQSLRCEHYAYTYTCHVRSLGLVHVGVLGWWDFAHPIFRSTNTISKHLPYNIARI